MLKASIAFLGIISLALLAVLFYDMRVSYQLGDWWGICVDLIGVTAVSGLMGGVGWAYVREGEWQDRYK